MYHPSDIFDNEIKAGDVIIYSVKDSTSVDTHLAVVDEVVDNGAAGWGVDRYVLKVRSFEKNAWYWDKVLREGSVKDRMYHTRLYSNQTIVKLNNFKFPEGFRALLNNKA